MWWSGEHVMVRCPQEQLTWSVDSIQLQQETFLRLPMRGINEWLGRKAGQGRGHVMCAFHQ